MKHEISQTRARRAGLALFALLTIPTTVAVLAGCSRMVEPPTAFAQDRLTAGYTFVEGQQRAVTLPAAMNGAEELTYSLTPPVPGLTLHESTRVLSGTPTAAGTYQVTYAATDTEGKTASLNLVITVVNSFTAVNSLRGTWRQIEEWRDGTEVDTLTFTASRYILHRAHYFADGTFSHEWTRSGTWKSTESTLTRIRMDDHDDDDDTPRIETTATAEYHWGDESRSKLLMPRWDWIFEGNDRYALYTRVVGAISEELTGTGYLLGTWANMPEGDEGVRSWSWRIALTPTEFTATIVGLDWTDTLTGTYEIDYGEGFILVTVVDYLENGESILDTDERWWKGQISRWAFAPTNKTTEIIVSPHWWEQEWRSEDQEWVDRRPRLTHGYWLRLMRTETTPTQ